MDCAMYSVSYAKTLKKEKMKRAEKKKALGADVSSPEDNALQGLTRGPKAYFMNGIKIVKDEIKNVSKHSHRQ